ncbi:MAG: hypothetical protein U1F59_00640 [Candidatus Competibacteraceae bacterium]
MGLNALDYVFLTNNQLSYQMWLERTHFRTRELQEQLAEQAAANQGRKAIIDALVAAYENEDWQTIQAILGDYDTRRAIYQAKYFPTLQSMMPA